MDTNIEQITPQSDHRHSSFGVAAFIIGWVPLCIMLVYLGFIEAYLLGLTRWISQYLGITLVVVTSSGCLLSLIAFILGVIALFQKNQKKIFAFLGIALSLLGFALTIVYFFSIFVFTS